MAKAAAISFGSAVVAQGIGDKFGHDASFLESFESGIGWSDATMKAITHGLSRVAFAKIQNQKTSSAFWSGFVTSGFAASEDTGYFGGTVIMALVSGTTSEISGGKFANGAVTGAFIHMYNALGDTYEKEMSENKIYGQGLLVVGGNTGVGYLQGGAVGGLRAFLKSVVSNFDNLFNDLGTTGKIVGGTSGEVAEEVTDESN